MDWTFMTGLRRAEVSSEARSPGGLFKPGRAELVLATLLGRTSIGTLDGANALVLTEIPGFL